MDIFAKIFFPRYFCLDIFAARCTEAVSLPRGLQALGSLGRQVDDEDDDEDDDDDEEDDEDDDVNGVNHTSYNKV